MCLRGVCGVAGKAVVSELMVALCVVLVSCSDTNSIMDVCSQGHMVPGIGCSTAGGAGGVYFGCTSISSRKLVTAALQRISGRFLGRLYPQMSLWLYR